jgi:hypothetical protein
MKLLVVHELSSMGFLFYKKKMKFIYKKMKFDITLKKGDVNLLEHVVKQPTRKDINSRKAK